MDWEVSKRILIENECNFNESKKENYQRCFMGVLEYSASKKRYDSTEKDRDNKERLKIQSFYKVLEDSKDLR